MYNSKSLEDVRKAIIAAITTVEDVEHGLDCTRNRDDYDCNCHFTEAVDYLEAALNCLPRNGE